MTALALRGDQDFWDDRQLAALRQMGVENASNGDLAVFLHQSQKTGLDPFSRQIYMIGRWDKRTNGMKWTIQSSIDGLRIVAQRSGEYAGQVGPFWCGADGQWRDVWLENTPPAAAKVGVLRRNFAEPLWGVARWESYAQTGRDGSPTPMWARMGDVMLAKCAEALALRKAFPHDLSGIYTDDEMSQARQAPENNHGALVHETLKDDAGKSADRTTPPPVDEWSTSDPAWLAEWRGKLADASDRDALAECWSDLTVALAAGQVVEADANGLRGEWQDRKEQVIPPEVPGQADILTGEVAPEAEWPAVTAPGGAA